MKLLIYPVGARRIGALNAFKLTEAKVRWQ